MNILVFSPIPSHPQFHGHRKRIFNLTKYLQQMDHVIHFIYFSEDGLKNCDCEAMAQEWETLTLIEKTSFYDPINGNYGFDAWYQENIAEEVNRIVDLFNIDVLWLNYVWHSRLLEDLPPNVLKVIDTHDKFSNRFALYGRNGDKSYRWFSCSAEDEGRYLDRADVVVAIQAEEAEYFRSICSNEVVTLNHIERRHLPNKKLVSLKRIGFLGTDNTINVTSINSFLKVWYNHSKYSDSIEVIIAGDAGKKVICSHQMLRLPGRIDTLEGFYDRVDLVIVPLVFGTGLKIKSVEALAYGVPIVSTVVGFEGIGSDSRYHNAPTPHAMVSLIDELYEHPADLQALGELTTEIFIAYQQRFVESLDAILHKVEPSTVDQEKSSSKKMIGLYRELQQCRRKHQLSNSHEFAKLMKDLSALCNLKAAKNPLKKLRAYKLLMQTYHAFK